jgi:DNA-binding NarL/FixJ family response regulator
MVRDGLRGMLAGQDDFEVVGEAASGSRRCAGERDRPDVVLMDLQMPEMDGATATAEIAARFPAIRAAARGETVLAPTVATRLVSRMRGRAAGEEALTSREVEVLELVARGASNADIAAALERGIISLPRRPR